MLSKNLSSHIETLLGSGIENVRNIAGGDISTALSLTTAEGSRFFLKLHAGELGRSMLQAEARGLKLLAQSGTMNVPTVIHLGYYETAFLLLESLLPAKEADTDWEEFGRQLAAMHGSAGDAFGLDHDNFIGSIEQINSPTTEWTTFYAEHRIRPLLDKGRVHYSKGVISLWDRLEGRLEQLIPCSKPSLIHGDLWSGNAMYTREGFAIYDPAICYADRLMDIAMARLFGGFSHAFFDAYFESSPNIEGDVRVKVDMYQLYYLMVHVVLFGGSYVPSVERILRRYAY